jgi:hypothetical protein
VERNYGTVSYCYSLAEVTGESSIEGLVGTNGYWDFDAERRGAQTRELVTTSMELSSTLNHQELLSELIAQGG